ncbi:MAG: hypothetical protein ACKO01_11615 [Erythrobacter sp.]
MNNIESAPNGSPSRGIVSTSGDGTISNTPPLQAHKRAFELLQSVVGQWVKGEPDRLAELIRLGENLVAHMQHFGCLPFPAGPRVPRRFPRRPALIGLGLTHAVRAERAMRMLSEVFGEKATQKPESEDLPQHLWVAPVEWASRHQAPELGLEALVDDLPMLFDAIAMLYFESTGGSNEHAAFFEELVEVLKRKRSEDMRAFSAHPGAARPRLDERELGYLHPFAAPHYDSACCDGMQPDAEDEFPAPNDADREFVARRCKSPAGAWPLLAMLFLKLLFSHIGWMASDLHLEKSQLPRFFKHVRAILRRIVRDERDNRDGLAATAAGLVACLPKIAPCYTASTSPDNPWQAKADELPDCFNIYKLGLEAQTRAEAVALFAFVDGDANGPLAGLASDVVELAREVASLLTDPLAAPTLDVLGFNRDAFVFLHYKLTGQRRIFPELKRGGLAVDDANGSFIDRCVPPADAARVFAPRMRRLIEYTHWMSEQGIDAVNRAAAKASLVLPHQAQEGNAR